MKPLSYHQEQFVKKYNEIEQRAFRKARQMRLQELGRGMRFLEKFILLFKT